MRLALGIALGAVAFGFVAAGLYWASDPRARPLSDESYIERASRTPQAREFVKKYPDAERIVDRGADVAVDFRVEASGGRSLRLRVRFDRFTNRPTDVFAECAGSPPERDVLAYLATERCLAGP